MVLIDDDDFKRELSSNMPRHELSVISANRDTNVNPKLGETLNSQISIDVSPRISVGDASSLKNVGYF